MARLAAAVAPSLNDVTPEGVAVRSRYDAVEVVRDRDGQALSVVQDGIIDVLFGAWPTAHDRQAPADTFAGVEGGLLRCGYRYLDRDCLTLTPIELSALTAR